MDKKWVFISVSALLVIMIAWWQPLNIGRTEVAIPDKASAREIAVFLAEQHVVRNVDEFLLWLKLLGREKELKAGTYELYKYKNPVYLIGRLCSGGKSEIIVTLREGLTIRETAQILAEHGLVDPDLFIDLCHDKALIADLGLTVSSLEGYFFPDTYSFSSLQSEEAIIRTMVNNFKKRTAKLNLADGDSLHRVIILASIVEKEAKYEDERPIIARVFLNRLQRNRPLESCATVFYILKTNGSATARSKLTENDLGIESPYNTYLHIGLPPGPICSPGLSSIKAVLSPAKVDYMYFVAKGDGRHHFSRTYQEHMAAKGRYQ
jgi:UPF0755 protein